MKILISGASGYVGSHLVPFLEKKGHQVSVLTRSGTRGIQWDPAKGIVDLPAMEGFDAFINLTGENVGDGRWTENKKQRIRDSRVLSTLTMAKAISELKQPPAVLINTSAVGFYATHEPRICDESAHKGTGFLSDVCFEREQAAKLAKERGVRVVDLRVGVVLSRDGGALQRMLIPFRLCFGGVLGSGKQYMSWIAMPDLLRAIEFCLTHQALSGPVNAVSPEPITNRRFTKTLGRFLWRPTLFWMPVWLVKLVFGEMGQELLLPSVRAVPRKLQDAGFTYQVKDLKKAFCI